MNIYIAENILQNRAKLDWTQEQLAERIGVTMQAVSSGSTTASPDATDDNACNDANREFYNSWFAERYRALDCHK